MARVGTTTPTVVVSDRPLQPSLPLRDHWRPLVLIYQDKRNGTVHLALWRWSPSTVDFEQVMAEAKAKGLAALLSRMSEVT